jgi:hypothetical protein
MSTEVETSLDLERFDSLTSRSLSLRPSRPRLPGPSILDYAEFTLSERSESNGLRSK